MAKYRVRENCYVRPAGWATDRYCKTGKEIEFDGDAPEIFEPIGPGPHKFAPRKFDLPGREKMHWLKRAEVALTTKPMEIKK